MGNEKNRLQELVQNIGYLADCISYDSSSKLLADNQSSFTSTVTVRLNMDITIIKEGQGSYKRQSQNRACGAALEELTNNYPALCVDWKKIDMEAQAGDALIKLAAYLTDEFDNSEDKSIWLQCVESDANLEAIFDRMYKAKDPAVSMFGKNLGKKHKATWIEALIWKDFSELGVPPSLKNNLKMVFDFLDE